MEKRIRTIVHAPYKRITTSSSVWKIGDKPSVSVEYKETNFDSIDVANIFHTIAREFEKFAKNKETRYITDFKINSKIFFSPIDQATLLGFDILAQTSDSELK